MRLFLLILVPLLLGSGGNGAPKAIFILLDGIPADVIESVDTPTLDEIAGESGYTRGFVGGAVGTESESPTVSAVSYNSLLTGTWSNKNNVWTNSIKNPDYDFWDIFRIAKEHDASLRTAIFSTWTDNRTKLLGDGLEAAGGSKLDHFADGYELDIERFPVDDESLYIRDIDEVVAKAAAEYLLSDAPDLSWVYLQYTDDVAHLYGDGPEMQAAVRWMDAQVGRIWSAIKQREASANEDWLVIVTTDHGRDAATGKDHGDHSERERTIWIVTNSKRLTFRFYQYPGIVDVLPSIATHLGLEIPDEIRAQLDGQSFIEETDLNH